MVHSITKLRNYLLGKPFVVLTDHCALCSLRKKMPNSPRLRRWAILLSEYDFPIQYVKGEMHRDVDCLSRAQVDQEIDAYLDEKLLAVLNRQQSTEPINAISVPLNDSEWKRLTENDADSQAHLANARRRAKGYRLCNGQLYFENRLYVPSSKRQELLSEAHDDESTAHGGVRATVARLASLWWPQLADDVRSYIRSCRICQLRKTERSRPSGSMHSFDVFKPVQLVAVDSLGPLAESVTGRKHVIVAIDCFSRFVEVNFLLTAS